MAVLSVEPQDGTVPHALLHDDAGYVDCLHLPQRHHNLPAALHRSLPDPAYHLRGRMAQVECVPERPVCHLEKALQKISVFIPDRYLSSYCQSFHFSLTFYLIGR